jgi:putative membrane protein
MLTMRRAFFTAGIVTLSVVWLGPLPQLAQASFFAHMTMHMGVVAVAAPFLALGLGRTRFDPVRFAPLLFAPIVASMIELLVVWAWHAPVLHHFARHTTAGIFLEQSMFLFCGLLLWLSAFGGDGPQQNSRRGTGVIALLLTSMHMTLLGALLALSPRPVYHDANEMQAEALADQHLGGSVMLIVGGVSYLAGGLALAVSLLRGAALETDEARS